MFCYIEWYVLDHLPNLSSGKLEAIDGYVETQDLIGALKQPITNNISLMEYNNSYFSNLLSSFQ